MAMCGNHWLYNYKKNSTIKLPITKQQITRCDGFKLNHYDVQVMHCIMCYSSDNIAIELNNTHGWVGMTI
jgi:hypothetical protein